MTHWVLTGHGPRWPDSSVNRADKVYSMGFFKAHNVIINLRNNFLEKRSVHRSSNLEQIECSLHQMSSTKESSEKIILYSVSSPEAVLHHLTWSNMQLSVTANLDHVFSSFPTGPPGRDEAFHNTWWFSLHSNGEVKAKFFLHIPIINMSLGCLCCPRIPMMKPESPGQSYLKMGLWGLLQTEGRTFLNILLS